MKLFLGIDGGQSSTTALIGDETGRVLGEGVAGPCNHVGAAERRTKFYAAVGESVKQAASRAGVDPVFAAVCAGFSGGSNDKDALTRELIRSERYLVTHDAHIALAGATGGGPGVVVIAGTGSIAYGRDAEGRTARAGGWGYVFGDEGSAFDIVRQAVRAMLRHEEGWGAPAPDREALLAATGASSANELLHLFYTDAWPRERVAALASLITDEAILNGAAQALATIAAAVRHQLGVTDVRYAGGVFSNETLLARFRMLAEIDGQAHVSPPMHPPAYGALLEAIRLTK